MAAVMAPFASPANFTAPRELESDPAHDTM
jgi:hypothetical protein